MNEISTQLQLTPLCTPVLLACNMRGFYKHSFVGYYYGVCLGFLQLQLLRSHRPRSERGLHIHFIFVFGDSSTLWVYVYKKEKQYDEGPGERLGAYS